MGEKKAKNRATYESAIPRIFVLEFWRILFLLFCVERSVVKMAINAKIASWYILEFSANFAVFFPPKTKATL